VKNDDISLFDKTRFATSPRSGFSPSGSIGTDSQGAKRDRDEDDGTRNSRNGGSHLPERPASAQPIDSRPSRYEAPPSPKRQRRESSIGPPSVSQTSSQVPFPSTAQNGCQSSTPSQVDDVQQRIDEIINASVPPNPPNPNPYPHPPLSRRPSQQQQQWQGPPPRRRSSSISSRQRPLSSQDGGHIEFDQNRSSSRRPPSYDPQFDDRRGDYNQGGRRFSQDQRQDEPLGSHQDYQPVLNGASQADEAEMVDYGSEEGEL